MPTLSDVVPQRAWVSVSFGQTVLTVAYLPAVVTPRMQKAVAAAQATQDLDAGLLDPISRLIDSWDLTDDDGHLIDLTPDALADVPAAVLLEILSAIGEHMAPNRSRDADSRNGSSPASSAASRTGTPS